MYGYPPYSHPPPFPYATPQAIMPPPPGTAVPEGSSGKADDAKGKKRSRKTGEEGARTKKTKEFHVEPNTSTGGSTAVASVSFRGEAANGSGANGHRDEDSASPGI